jgi:putative ABC transport system permease protein
MNVNDIAGIAITNMSHQKLRSGLTILGIVIATTAIIVLIGLSMGVSETINSNMRGIGANIIQISPGGQQATRMPTMSFTGGGGGGGPPSSAGGQFGNTRESATITFDEAKSLRSVEGVVAVDARLSDRAKVTYHNKNASLQITGTDPSAFKLSVGTTLYSGRYLTTSDQYSAVVGFSVANATFSEKDLVNKQIKIDNKPFTVVGILNQTGSMGGTDNAVFIPISTAQDIFNQSEDASSIVVVVGDSYNTTSVADALATQLRLMHRVTADTQDFSVTTAASLQSATASVSSTLQLFLVGIASISLIVGGIGVANTMFMSVMEQTRNIGVLKALGAKDRDIVFIFLCEAMALGAIGGGIGVALSFVIAAILTTSGLSVKIPLELVIGGIVFSAIIGIVAGISPAQRAAEIPPVEALRYE